MKIILTQSIMLIMLMKYNMATFIINLILTTLFVMINMSMKFPMIFFMTSMDLITMIMMLLTMMSVILIILSSNNMSKIITTIIPILLILLLTFNSSNMLMFYIMFELVLMPTMMLIMMDGKQPERLQASIYLIMYTVMASLPLLMMIIFWMKNMSFPLSNLLMLKFTLILFMMLAFLAKMPMYMLHIWLPKAHVEAPLEGSMILAAVLLKLGGYGIMRFIPICLLSINKMNYWIISISMIGATTTSMNCIRQKDLKSLIAYSSVAHMGFVLSALFTMNYMSTMGAIIMMLGHGLSSSALFLLVNEFYMKYHTRNILMFKGVLSILPNLTFWWFMFMSLNISAPPTINTLSEIMMMSGLISWNNSCSLMIFMMSLMTASFSLLMFVSIIHNKNNMNFSTMSNQKTFLSLFIHITPTMIMIMKPELIYM